MPFDWKTPLGFPIAWFSQFATLVAVVPTSTQYFGFIYVSCGLFIYIAEDITKDLDTFNNTVEIPNADRAELTKHFFGVIQLYSDAKE